MKKGRFSAFHFIILNSLFFVASYSQAANEKADQIFGQPGCLRLIQGHAISDQRAAHLSKPCRDFRSAYLKNLDQLSNDPKKLSEQLKQSVESAKDFKSPYTVLLISVLSQNPEQNKVVVPALEKRAAIEKKLNLNYAYASAALEKIKSGSCKSFKDEAYSEICTGEDAVYARIVALNQTDRERKKK